MKRACLVASVAVAIAAHPFELSTSPHLCSRATNEPPQLCQVQQRPYDVTRYDLLLDWRTPLSDSSAAARPYSGVMAVTLRCTVAQLDTIELDADPMLAVDSVLLRRSASQRLPAQAITRRSDQVILRLPQPLRRDDSCTVVLYYRNISTESVQQDFYGGYNRYWRDEKGNLLPAPLAYTMSEPNSARRWMPCNDRPYDKATASITILAPRGFTTLSNGSYRDTTITVSSERLTVRRYTSTEPIATYLMVAVASRFSTLERLYRSRDSVRTIPLRLYLWHSDSVEYADNAAWMLSSTAAMMDAFEKCYVPYPFGSYGQVLLLPYFRGAMEHQTMTTLHRDALVQRWETVVAHELMHHWTGNLVTCATWNDIWLNEGGATYGEYLWLEATQGRKAATQYFVQRRNRDYFRNDSARSQPPVYNTTGVNLFNTGTTYVKAGWIYHMMRTMLGDSAFFDLMRRYFTRFAYQSLTTEDFVAFCEEVVPAPPISWRRFFDQWIYAVGHPILRMQLESLSDGSSPQVQVRISQVQDTARFLPVYEVPVRLRFLPPSAGTPYDTVIVMRDREVAVSCRVPFNPSRIELDPDDEILCQKDTLSVALSIPIGGDRTAGVIAPNPVLRGQPISVIVTEELVGTTLTLHTLDGRTVGRYAVQSQQLLIPTSDLAPGIYILSRLGCIVVVAD